MSTRRQVTRVVVVVLVVAMVVEGGDPPMVDKVKVSTTQVKTHRCPGRAY